MTTEIALKTVSANDGLRNLNLTVKTVNASWKANVAYLKSANDYLGASKAQYHGLTEEMEKQTHVLTSLKEKQGNITDTTTKGAAAFLRYEQDIKRAEVKLTSLEAQQLRSKNAMEKQESGIVKLSQSLKTNNTVMDSYVNRLKAEGKEEEALVQKKRQLVTEGDKQHALYQKEVAYLGTLEQSVGKASDEYKKQKVVINELGTSIAKNLSAQKDLVAEQEKARLATIKQKSGIDELRKSYSLSKEVNDSYVNGLKSQGNNLKSLEAQQTNLKNSLKSGQIVYDKELSYLKKIERETGSNSDAYKRQVIEVNKSATSLNKMANELKDVQRNSDKIRPFSSNAFVNGFDKISNSSRQFSGALKDNILKYGALTKAAVVGVATITAATGAGLIAGAKTATDLQDAYIKNRGLLVTGDVSGASAAKKMSDAQGVINQMQKEGRNLSLEYGKSQQEVANGYQELIKRGYEGEQALGAYDAIVMASVAAHEDLGTVTEVTASTLDSFGMRVGDSTNIMKNSNKVVNELAYAADATATNFKDIGVAMSYVGASAKQSGYSLAETSSALGILSNNGLEAQKAGTGLRKAMSSLQAPTANGADALDRIGLSTKDFVNKKGDMKSMTEIFGMLNEHTKKLGGAEKGVLFKALFGETGKQAGTILSQNATELGKLNDRVADASKNNYVKDLAEKNMKSVQASLNKFKAAANDILQTIGAAIIPALGDVATATSKAMQSPEVQKALKKISKSLEEAGEKVSEYVKKLKPKDFANGLNILADGAKTTIDILVKTAKALYKIGQGISAIGKFANKHKEAVEKFGKVLAAIWIISKVTKFKRALEDLGLIFSPQAKQVAILTDAIIAQNTMIAENTSLRKINEGVGVADGGVGGAGGAGGKLSKAEKAAGKTSATVGSRVKIAAEAADAAKIAKSGTKLGKLGGSLSKLGSGLGKLGKGNALLLGVTSAMDLIGMTKKTAGEHIGKAAGSFSGGAGGALAGAAAGAAVPILGETGISEIVGAAIGGIAGSSIGQKLGGKIGDGIQKGLKPTKKWFGQLFSGKLDWEKDIGEATGKANKILLGWADKTGKKIGKTASSWGKNIGKGIGNVKDWFGDIGGKIGDFFGGLIKKVGLDKVGKSWGKAIGKAVGNVGDWFKDLPGNITDWFEDLGGNMSKGIKKAWDKATKKLSGFGDGVKKWFDKTMKSIDDNKLGHIILTIGKIIGKVVQIIGEFIGAIAKIGFGIAKLVAGAAFKGFMKAINKMVKAFKKIGKTAKKMWKDVSKFFGNLYDDTKKIMGDIGKWLGEKWDSIKKDVSKKAKKMWKDVSKPFSDGYKYIKKIMGQIGKWFGDKWSTISKAVSKTVKQMWSYISKPFSDGYKYIKKIMGQIGDWFSKKWESMKKSAIKIAGGIWDGIKKPFKVGYAWLEKTFGASIKKIWDKISKFGSDTVKFFKGLPGKIGSVIRDGYDAVLDGFTHIANGGIKGISHLTEGARTGLNWISNKVGMGDAVKGSWALPTFATGTPGGKALVNDAKGELYQEMYRRPNGKMGVFPAQRNMIVDLEPGTEIATAKDTKSYLDMMPQYSDGTGFLSGIGQAISGVTSSISSTFGDIFNKGKDLIEGAAKVIAHPIEFATGVMTKNMSGKVSPLIKESAEGMPKYVGNEAKGWILSLFKKVEAKSSSAPAGKGVQRWKGQVIQALKANGLSTSPDMVNRVLRQIASESGGNEKATQHGYTDINSISGDLAKGLMQVIGTTFAANKFPGHGNVFNGYDNILAGLHYAKAAYGKGLGALGNGHGYANGGIINKHGMVEVGEGDKQEYIIPMDKMKNTRAISLLSSAVSTLQAQNGGNDTNEGQSQINELTAQISTLTDIVAQFMGMVEAKPVISQRDIYKSYNSVRKVDLGLRKYNEGKTV